MNHEINRLIHFGLEHGMIQEEDKDYTVNLLLDLFQLEDFEWEDIYETLSECTPILENMLDYAVAKKFIENNITSRDLFDTRIMNCLMPRPSEVVKTFYERYQFQPLRQIIIMVYPLHLTILEKVELIRIFVLKDIINMAILKSQSIFQSQKKTLKRLQKQNLSNQVGIQDACYVKKMLASKVI